MEYISNSPLETQKIAARFIIDAIKRPRSGALCVGLEGELGAGKTTFTQGIAKGLGITRIVQSPTFIIMRPLVLPKTLHGISTFYHFDWYRLSSPSDIKILEWDEIISNTSHLVLVEWADKFPSLYPEGMIQIYFSIKDSARKISFL
ncbi:MAG: tRNA (adenosine(37)-N6)-threonylcarbamoyltransferase complex ATPase subunit type 1 TsaE [Candidatus Spechtbacteria bacterium]|nr:tRNA (adenosine(37)-N6)-threonylcarbamoyltransferase complex ATPase subunit type 1 TsaE [Candidatus Spechtbacteria bacterium]